ncbi:hypothetical protein HZB89_01640 [archaeon]|nr:hypothetical protein [archaeon]
MALRKVIEDVDNIAFFVFFGFILVWMEITWLKQEVYQQVFFLDYFVLAVILVITAIFLWKYYKTKFA